MNVAGAGKFSVESDSKELFGLGKTVARFPLVWGKGYVSKYAFILWFDALMVQKKVMTKDRLLKWGMVNICPRSVLYD